MEKFKTLEQSQGEQASFDVMRNAGGREGRAINAMSNHDMDHFLAKYYKLRRKIPAGHHVKKIK